MVEAKSFSATLSDNDCMEKIENDCNWIKNHKNYKPSKDKDRAHNINKSLRGCMNKYGANPLDIEYNIAHNSLIKNCNTYDIIAKRKAKENAEQLERERKAKQEDIERNRRELEEKRLREKQENEEKLRRIEEENERKIQQDKLNLQAEIKNIQQIEDPLSKGLKDYCKQIIEELIITYDSIKGKINHKLKQNLKTFFITDDKLNQQMIEQEEKWAAEKMAYFFGTKENQKQQIRANNHRLIVENRFSLIKYLVDNVCQPITDDLNKMGELLLKDEINQLISNSPTLIKYKNEFLVNSNEMMNLICKYKKDDPFLAESVNTIILLLEYFSCIDFDPDIVTYMTPSSHCIRGFIYGLDNACKSIESNVKQQYGRGQHQVDGCLLL